METAFEARRNRYAKSIARAHFHEHLPEAEASNAQIETVMSLADEGACPKSYAKLAERRVLDKEEASQLIEAALRFKARRKRGIRIPFRPCESKRAVQERLRRSVAQPEQLRLAL